MIAFFSFLRELWYGCLFRHSSDTIWEADAMRCLRCGTVIQVLPQKRVIGPAHVPAEVRGQPKMQAKTVRPGNVTDIRERQSQR